MPNYMNLIGNHYPAVGANCEEDPTVYANISWVDGDSLPSQADLDTKDLTEYMTAKILSLSASCAYDVVNGFESTADGLHTTAKWYDSQPEDQMNLIGSVAAGDTQNFPCRDTQTGDKNYIEHTNAQLKAVIQDGRDLKLSKLTTFNTKKGQVLAATDKAGVDAITWP